MVRFLDDLKKLTSDSDLTILYINIALYAACYQMQRPMLPELISSLAEDEKFAFAKVQSLSGVFQTLGGVASGPLMDRFGPRLLFMLSFLASFLSYFLTVRATNLWDLYLALIPTILQHAMMSARAYVALKVRPDDRAALSAYLMSAYGVGFVAGPPLGGWLTVQFDNDPKVATMVATAGSAVSSLLVFAFLRDAPRHEADAQGKDAPSFSFSALLQACRSPSLLTLFCIKTTAAGSVALIHTYIPTLMTVVLGMSVKEKSASMAVIGSSAFLSAFVVSTAKSYFSEKALLVLSSLFVSSLFAALALCYDAFSLTAVMCTGAVVGAVFNNVNSAQLASSVPRTLVGSITAFDMSIGSCVRVLAPFIVELLRDRFGESSVPLTAAGGLIVVSAMAGCRSNAVTPRPASVARKLD
eukprot:Hpha_TRINITY_DN20344_c0_g1::TRINITY_DN20344_c0_g1_i1::g.138208::m.138208/K08214/SLC22A18; MFS transporter, OCT family, solute carrier family 22 (organic cation transporter), member 18